MNKKVLYTALVLDEKSREQLLERFISDVPGRWKILAHHSTIYFWTQETERLKNWCKENEGRVYDLLITEIGRSDKALAVKVESQVPSANKVKHITLACSESGAPKDSNFITDWRRLPCPIKVTGKVKFFYRDVK